MRTIAVLDYVGGHFELEQSDMIFTRFSGPVLWIGKEKIMIEFVCFLERVPWPG